ncbi:MAG: methyltransferase domain-containing protein, partial [Gammaproteobacteria bacterium]
NSFDAIVCTASFEYLTQPDEVLNALASVLKPGGLLVITFSNRWFPTKAVKIWSDIHEFERIGLVSECLQRNGDFSELHTLSSRGLPRPRDDKYASELLLSDPVYALWATRR